MNKYARKNVSTTLSLQHYRFYNIKTKTVTSMRPWTSRLRKLSLRSYTAFADRNFEIGISVRWSQNDGKFSPDELWQGKYDVVLKRSQRITNECYMGFGSPALPRRSAHSCPPLLRRYCHHICSSPVAFSSRREKRPDDQASYNRAYRFLSGFRDVNPAG